ncbi:phosphodiesterase [Domibacillus antri]|uniref:Phosphodiesterase n=1 Tax=Domibacillus antri TaxID=1714264 RepID=A0A1Q8Q4P7_9BACI|nr:alkaline phosphatase family protein [Domibacillus antri]OLN22265.1 phosphodiesterase [Domibacillus antri]
MVRKIFLSLILFTIVTAGLCWYFLSTPVKDVNNISIKPTEKPVIVLVIDSLMAEPLQKAIEEGKAPAFEFLMKHGQYHPNVVSSYPTMSVTIDSTMLTGTYADQHKVAGLSWFKKEENRLVVYGGGIREMWSHGLKNVTRDSVIQLNQSHLNKRTPTIYEELEKRQIQSASINGLIHRGEHIHRLHIPPLVSGMNLLPNDVSVSGPNILSLGRLSTFNPDNDRSYHMWKSMGLNNPFTANELKYFILRDQLPSFTLAYFPDMDHLIHKKGPKERKGIEEVDKQLQTILNAYPSWDAAIQNAIWVVHGDSGQSTVLTDRSKALIDLNTLLNEYTIWQPDDSDQKQLALAVNERMGYIYVEDESIDIHDILSKLKSDSRIAFIAWKEEYTSHVMRPGADQPFTFSPSGRYRDPYGQSWDLNGDASILDVTINEKKDIQYGDYPDALARLYGALHSHEGRYMIVDAKPGYEFIQTHSEDHAGGAAHGSLHKVDSVVPLIIAGTNREPKHLRLVDFKDWLVELTK